MQNIIGIKENDYYKTIFFASQQFTHVYNSLVNYPQGVDCGVVHQG